jgi:hypothetical protein
MAVTDIDQYFNNNNNLFVQNGVRDLSMVLFDFFKHFNKLRSKDD